VLVLQHKIKINHHHHYKTQQ